MKNKSLWILSILVVLAFAGYSYVDNNLGNILCAKANRYFKKNNIPQAQEYYEKAFDLGVENRKAREIYVNTLINSPLTVVAQEKLLKFLQNQTEDLARLKARYFIEDFKDEIYKKYPHNYIIQTVHNQKVVHWGKFPITYGFVNTGIAPQYFVEEIENAFSEWEKSTNHQILFSREDKNPDIIIKFNTHNTADKSDKLYVVAYTTPSTQGDLLKNMQINFYLKDLENKYFSQNQIYNTALHEIVHALGFMGHSDDKENIMYLMKDSVSVAKDARENLTEADINTVKLLYKIKPDITNSEELKYDYLPQLILGSAQEVNTAKIREAQNYIRKAPELSAGYIDLAEGYVAVKEYPKAIKSLEKALRLADSREIQGIIYYNLAVAYYYIDHLEMAKNYLQKSLQIKDSDSLHYLLAEIYQKEEKYEEASQEYKFLVDKNPNNIEYTIALTNIYIIRHQFIKARKVLKNYIKNNPAERNNPRFEPYGIIRIGL